MNELIDSYGMEVVQAYMSHIQNNAELAVRDLLRDVAKRFKRDNSTSERTVTLEADDRLDDGSTIMLRIDINASEVRTTATLIFFCQCIFMSFSKCFVSVFELLNMLNI